MRLTGITRNGGRASTRSSGLRPTVDRGGPGAGVPGELPDGPQVVGPVVHSAGAMWRKRWVLARSGPMLAAPATFLAHAPIVPGFTAPP